MKGKSCKILHITPHVGGGVGSVLMNYLVKVKDDPGFEHTLACLEYANDKASKMADDSGFKLLDEMAKKKKKLLAELTKADVVVIHWWNHPLLYDFLVRSELPPCRLVIWSHISGFHPPYVFTEKILNYPDTFVFTTPLSFKAKEVRKLENEQKKKLRVVWSTGGVEGVKSVKRKKYSGFNVGYLGTVDYAKLHPNFLSICNRIKIPDIKFIVCGGPSEKEIKREAENLGIEKKFEFSGYVSDISKYLSIFDVFGYPLAPYHYGTCDQVLQESMAAGVVPVVMNNRMERYMIKDGLTGIVAKSENEYIQAIQTLYKDEALRNKLSENARAYAIKTFSLNTMAQAWENIFKEIMAVSKNIKKWKIAKKGHAVSAMDVFIESLGDYGKDFIFYCNATSGDKKKTASKKIRKLAESINWRVKTRGTVHHYNSFFPDDRCLSACSELMKINKS